MKIVLLFLVLLNVLFYGWSQWVAKQPLDLAVVTPEPEAERLALFAEAFPERARAERQAREKAARDERLAQREAAAMAREQAQLDAALDAGMAATSPAEAPAAAAEDATDSESKSDQSPTTAPVADDNVPVDEVNPEAASDGLGDAMSASPVVVEAPASLLPEAPGLATTASGPDASASDGGSAPESAGPGAGPGAPSTEAAVAALDELAAVSGKAAATRAREAAQRDPVARCFTLGPFVSEAGAAQAVAALRNSGADVSQRSEASLIWVGHWVYLPPAESRAEAIAVVERLRADGVSDIYIETSGEMRNAISLGLFSDAAGAETRAGKIRQLDVRPEIRDRFRDGALQWLDVELAPGRTIDLSRYRSGSDRRELKLEERDCGEPVAARG